MDTLQDRVTPSVNDSGTCEKSGTRLTQNRSPGVLGFTYFVRAGDAIKIGAATNPKDRISALQTAHVNPLDVLAVVPAFLVDEFKAHQLFAHLRIRGEWFEAAPELLYFIEQAKTDALNEPAPTIEKPRILLRPKPPASTILGVRRDLIAKRVSVKADSPLGHTYSNLIELLENRERAEPGSFAMQHFPRLIAYQMKRLEQLSKAA